MEEVIHYLELKNQYYEKFFSITSKFLEKARQNRWDDLEFFMDNRERILNIIHSYDFKIATIFERLDLTGTDLEVYRHRVKHLLDRRTDWGERILAQDLELMSKVEEMKSETIRDLKKALETSQQLNSFSLSSPPRLKPTKDA